MAPDTRSVKNHYNSFLAAQYAWMAGGFDHNLAMNREFLALHDIAPRSSGNALDLGAGCGFMTLPLLEAGFRVTAVDFCQPLLDELRRHAASRDVEIITGDIMGFPAWAGHRPELIACTGDTITHLPDTGAVSSLLRQCHSELEPGGKLLLSLRDYSPGTEGEIAVIPVRRDAERIFLCRLEYRKDRVEVTDIVYSRRTGTWERSASSYEKIRLSPDFLAQELDRAGFRLEDCEVDGGFITVIAGKDW